MYFRRRKPHSYSWVLLALLIIAFLIAMCIFLRNLSTKIAVSDAADIVTKTVNDSINQIIGSGDYGTDHFITLESDESGNITAINGNMAHINMLSTQILNSVISSTENGIISVGIPIGNLTGFSLLMGRGPDVVVDIVMLTSSRVDFKNEITPCGINQSKYQLMLEITVDVDVIVPWGTKSAQTVTEVIIADTVIIGKVPETYLTMEGQNGHV